ncbi:MAG: tRNA (adenosine(37)-N6)-threonylcarbamoyltransferase complex ATPase subunit type 1 TsaE [Clostridia bacterium]
MKYIVKSIKETYAIAKKLAKTLNGGENIILNGELGAGKTTFTKGLAEALGVKDVVTSPTFTFMKSYKGKFDLFHFDMYRVENEDELFELGLSDYLTAGGICVIEWNKFEVVPNKIVINIVTIDENSREIEII